MSHGTWNVTQKMKIVMDPMARRMRNNNTDKNLALRTWKMEEENGSCHMEDGMAPFGHGTT